MPCARRPLLGALVLGALCVGVARADHGPHPRTHGSAIAVVQQDGSIVHLGQHPTTGALIVKAVGADTGAFSVASRLALLDGMFWGRAVVPSSSLFALSELGPLAALRAALAPANDDCANAIAVTEGTTFFSTVGATTDGPDEPAACSFFGYTQVGSDIWYSYAPQCSSVVTIDLCASSYDTKIAVYDGNTCPMSASAIVCNEDSCGRQSRVAFNAVQGNQYLIRVGGFMGETGTGTMAIACAQPPANDDCANAVLVTEGTCPFDTTYASTDGPDEPGMCSFFGYTQIDADVWFEYQASCPGPVVVDLCGSGFDTKIAVYDYDGSTCPTTASAIACNDDACVLQSRVTFNAVQGNRYLLRIGGHMGETGAGTMTIYNSGSCALCGFYNGTGVNPPDYTCLTRPVLGTNWQGSIAINADTLLTYLVVSLGGPHPGIPIFAGEMLVNPVPSPIFVAGLGVYTVPIPNVGAGVVFSTQGLRVDRDPSKGGDLILVMTNRLDLLLEAQ